MCELTAGAPYESEGGAVYLYHGGSGGLTSTPAQIIKASQLPGSPLKSFGYSLSGREIDR